MKITVLFLDELEEKIRTNSAPKIEHFIKSQDYEIPRPLTARYANLLRRIGGTKYALSILNPLVRNETAKPSVEETIEYAACLCRLGLGEESIVLLRGIEHNPVAEIHYELAVAHLWKFAYPQAIRYLLKYLSFKDLGIYKVCIGKINLAACYLYTNEKEKAEALLENLLVEVKKNNFNLLWGNVLELFGEISIEKREFDLATKYFEEASKKLLASNPRYRLYLDKCNIIIKMLREKGSKESIDQWKLIRNQTAKIADWNSLRELELYKAAVTQDTNAITDLYYGVPNSEYRQRILLIWGKSIKNREYYDRKIGPGSPLPNKIFDVGSGKDLFTGAQLKFGQSLHRLMQALTSDFYAPFLTAKLFSYVFNGNYFNPTTSPHQIHMLVNRLNDWFLKNKLPFVVKHGKSGYRLRSNEAYLLRIPTNMLPRTKADEFLNLLKDNGFIKNFSAKVLVEKLGVSRRSVNRLLSDGVASGKLIREGSSQNTKYSFI